ncbi:hypothetical protein [Nonomuraea dietziae]|uniref:hypothetical protein n=1 Tax=Nonomuraea dietziae TaxID=65515 RepID=UPI0031D91C7C
MLPIRHWITFDDPGPVPSRGPRLEAPLVQLEHIHMPTRPSPPRWTREQATIYSWALNNIWDTNFPTAAAGRDDLPLRGDLLRGREGHGAGRAWPPRPHRPLPRHPRHRRRRPLQGGRLRDRGTIPRCRSRSLGAASTRASVVRLQSFADVPVEVEVGLRGLRSAQVSPGLARGRRPLWRSVRQKVRYGCRLRSGRRFVGTCEDR